MPGVRSRTQLIDIWRYDLDDHVIATAWAPDGASVAIGEIESGIKVLSTASGEVIAESPPHHFGLTDIAWHPHQALIASCGWDSEIRIIDSATGGVLHRCDAKADAVERIAWNRKGDRLAAAAGKTVKVWSDDGELIDELTGHSSTVTDIGWDPVDDSILASSSYGVASLWRPGTPEPARRFEWKGSILRIAWSPDGKYLATGDQDSTVHFWIVSTGQDLQMWGYETKVRELAWDRTSHFLATGGGTSAVVWDCWGKGPEGSKPLMLQGHDQFVSFLKFQNRGTFLASGGFDGRVYIWNPDRGKRSVASLELDEGISSLSWSPDDSRLAIGTEKGSLVMAGFSS